MTDHDDYFAYLQTRSRAAALYRRVFLYPVLNRHVEGRALDVGCGLGDMLAFRANTVGVDVNPKIVAECRRRGFEAYLVENGRLPFEAESFDSAILDNVLEHVQSPDVLLLEIRRVVKSRGILLVGVPGERGFASDPDHKMHYDEDRLVRTLRASGFLRQRVFHVPWRARILSRTLRQYCMYGVFRRP